MHEVVDAELLQLEDDRRKVAPQDLGVGLFLELLDKVRLGVQPEALSGPGTTSPAGALGCACLRDRADEQGLDSDPGVVDLLLREARVDDVDDAVDRERRLGDVGRDDDLASGGTTRRTRSGCLVEDALLLLRRQRRVQRNGLERAELLRQLVGLDGDFPASVFDFLFTGQEHQDVAFWLGLVDHQDCSDRRLEVVGFRLRRVEAAGHFR